MEALRGESIYRNENALAFSLRCCADGSGTQKPGWSLQNRHWFLKQYLCVFYFPTCFYSNGITNNDFLFTIPLIRRNRCQQKMIESKS